MQTCHIILLTTFSYSALLTPSSASLGFVKFLLKTYSSAFAVTAMSQGGKKWPKPSRIVIWTLFAQFWLHLHSGGNRSAHLTDSSVGVCLRIRKENLLCFVCFPFCMFWFSLGFRSFNASLLLFFGSLLFSLHNNFQGSMNWTFTSKLMVSCCPVLALDVMIMYKPFCE